MIIDHIRNLEEFKNFFFSHPMPEDVSYDFDFVINNPNLFCFYDELTGKLKSYIILTLEDNKLYLSGASVRKNMPDSINAIVKVCNEFRNHKIYSYTKLKHAALLLKKAGFKQISQFEYIKEYRNG